MLERGKRLDQVFEGPLLESGYIDPTELAEVERRHISHVLQYCNGHREHAAELLQISTRTLYRRIKECEL